ncbi:MAG: nucleotide-binding universal stress UspA family protein [Hyphomicrobiaceae bacterium]|jgi:nucleotide-binding universal stress UspA family protein
MFSKILVPVDLGHLEDLSRALETAAEMAKAQNAEVVYVGVYGNLRSSAAPNPKEYTDKLAAFSDEQASIHGISTTPFPVFSHDPQAELTSLLLSAAIDTMSDVIVMASHVPGWVEHVFHSNAGYIASHASVSVFVIR